MRRYYKDIDVLTYELNERKIPTKYFINCVHAENKKIADSVLPVLLVEKESLKKQLINLKIEVDI